MSVFDFPRIQFNGVIRVNVGTGNNDDFSSTPSKSDKNFLFTGCPHSHVRSFNSKDVQLSKQPEMSPEAYVEWMKKEQTLVNEETGETQSVTPGYWNYFGSMSIWADNIKVNKVTTSPEQSIVDPGTSNDPFIQSILGGNVSYDRWPQLPLQPGQNPKDRAEQLSTALMTDIKSEGSSPGSQIFADTILLQDATGKPVFYRNAGDSRNYEETGSKPTKASANMLASQGYECFFTGTNNGTALVTNPAAATTFMSIMPFTDDFIEDGFKDFLNKYADPSKGEIKGIVVNYVMYMGVHPLNTSKEWADLYKNTDFFDCLNERQCPVVGVITPWYGEDSSADTPDLSSTTLGREINMVPGLKMKTTGWTGGPPELPLTMSPILARLVNSPSYERKFLSVDISKSITSYFTGIAGTLSLCVGKNQADNAPVLIGNIEYGNPENDQFVDPTNQWNINADPLTQLFAPPQINYVDIDLPVETFQILNNQNPEYPDGGTLMLCTDSDLFTSNHSLPCTVNGTANTRLLIEQQYQIINNNRSLYAEQAINGQPSYQNHFRYDDQAPVTSTFQILKKGKVMTTLPTDETFYMLQCPTVPLPMAYNNKLTKKKIESMADLTLNVNVTQPGSFRFAVVSETFLASHPMHIFKDLDTYPICVAQVRVLPNEDYSQYFINPTADEPIGNDQLTFEVLFEKVLKPFFVLYPAMDAVRSLNNPEDWAGADSARRLLQRIDPANFNRMLFMPRTRDLSESRRQLIQAWCRKTLQGQPA